MTWLASFENRLTGITADSRKVQQGMLFLAYPGVKQDGRHYIEQAIAAGAGAVMWESAGFSWKKEWQISNIAVSGLKDHVGEIAAEFYGSPSQQLNMVGVTGTNGKTSVSQWIAQALTYLGKKTAVIGTIGNGFVNAQDEAHNTTPDAVLLQGMLADFTARGAKAVAMEVSSHGLHQGRVNGVVFDIAVLTNLSRDHLDYHETMEAYAAAKQQLFFWPELRVAVLNADDAFGQSVAEKLRAEKTQVITYGLSAGDVRGTDLKLEPHGLRLQVATPQGQAELFAPVLGRFNAYNVLAVVAVLLAMNIHLPDALDAIRNIIPVQGRMQQFGGDGRPQVVVDYAHTPDALEKVLCTLREQVQGKLHCVFGCGGDRDSGKRPLMGTVASHLADKVIVTSDNPRSEDPLAIMQQVLAGVDGACVTEPDRAKAIQYAVSTAEVSDMILVAGKGHENYQEIKGVKTTFSDAEVALKALKNYERENISEVAA